MEHVEKVDVVGKPADGERYDDYHEHFDNPLLLLLGLDKSVGGVANYLVSR